MARAAADHVTTVAAQAGGAIASAVMASALTSPAATKLALLQVRLCSNMRWQQQGCFQGLRCSCIA